MPARGGAFDLLNMPRSRTGFKCLGERRRVESDRDDWLKIIAIALIQILGGWVASFGAFLVGAAMDDLALTAVEAGALASAELLIAGVSSLVAAAFVGRFSPARVALSCVAVGVAMQVASTYMGSFWPLVPFRLGSGVASGLLAAVGYSVAASSINADRVFSYSVSLYMVGTGIMLSLMGIVVGNHGLVGAYWFQAAALVFAAVFFLRLSTGDGQDGDQSVEADAARPRSDLLVLIGVVLFFGVAVGPMFFFSERLGVQIGMDADRIGTVLTAATFAGLMGSLLAGRAASWLGRRRPVIIGTLLLGLGSVLYILASNAFLFLAMNLVVWLAYMFLYPFLLSAAAAFDPTGRVSVVIGGVFQLTLGVGPVVGGILFDLGSFWALTSWSLGSLSLLLLLTVLRGRFLDELEPG